MRKVLFVDDEQHVLTGLKRMFGELEDSWQASFVTSGQDALRALEQERFDVVISDMRMPGMSGAELLESVRERHPDCVRIVLSGQADHETALRSVNTAHQFLAKPCEFDSIVATIERATVLRDVLRDPKMRRLVARLPKLPSLPSVYERLLVEIERPESSMARVSEIVSTDVAMSAKLVQLVNSAFFGLPRRICDPGEAASYLGLEILRALTLGVQAFALFDVSKAVGFNFDNFQRHSLAVAAAAKCIAEYEGFDRKVVSAALLAGLMHDVGDLVLAAGVPVDWKRAAGLSRSTGEPDWSGQLAVMGTSHAAVGAYLLGLWGLPSEVVEAVALHHDSTQRGSSDITLAVIVYMADLLVGERLDPANESLSIAADDQVCARFAERVPAWRQSCALVLEAA